MKKIKWVLLLCIAFNPDPSEAQNVSNNLAWAQAYLMETIFTFEYEALMEINKNNDQFSPTFAVGDTAVKMWARAKLSLLNAHKAGRRLPHASKIEDMLKVQEVKLRDSLPGTDVGRAIMKGQADEAFLRSQVNAGIEERFRKSWQELATQSATSASTCALDPIEVNKIAEYQKSLLASQKDPNAVELLTPIKNWANEKIECLVFAFMTESLDSNKSGGLDPLALLQAIQLTGSKLAADEVLQVASVIRFLEKKQYPESLRILMDLQEGNNSYRLAVDTVQRIFSIRQQGSGKVAIRGI